MSRVIVKNLPENITEVKLREIFSEQGNITDIQLKHTKDGKFRQFGFIGFQTEEQGTKAIRNLNKTCIQTNKIIVESCVALGAEEKPRSWSKYSKDSLVNSVRPKDEENTPLVKDKKKKKSKVKEILEEHLADPQFIEFLNAHSKSKQIWENDLGLDETTKTELSKADIQTEESVPEDVKADSNDDDDDETDEITENNENIKFADQDVSDGEYRKALVKSSKTSETKPVKKLKKLEKSSDLLTIKIRNIPFKTKRQDVLTFFKPLKPFSIRLPVKVHGICYVGFKNDSDFKKAMLKNRSFWKGKQILFTDFTEKNKQTVDSIKNTEISNTKWNKQKSDIQNEEDISDSGNIFFRNLPYTVTEKELREMFGEFGPLAELNLPIDTVTRKIKGFGTVTYVMPEHAVLAFNKLDGSIFQGRLLHLIPGKAKEVVPDTDHLNFKQKKLLKQKESAGSSHNWNTLFLGENAVTEMISKMYQTSKEHILDTSSGGSSAAVRLALGETEIVLETKRFLESNEVQLDVFEKSNVKRSSNVIIAKNLPAGTAVNELQVIFAKHGLIGRIVMPNSGVTALIEFLEPSEARKAFKRLAYSKFKSLPLYLEWAPENTFKTPSTKAMVIDTTQSDTVESKNPFVKKAKSSEQNLKNEEPDDEPSVEEDFPPEPDTTLFLRNLNFKTREPSIREHFRTIGQIHMIQVAIKKDPENPQVPISLGYGFIQFKHRRSAERALTTMKITTIEGNRVELARSDRTLQSQNTSGQKAAKAVKQTGSKLLVRNIPFQAKQHEIQEIFQSFGELKTVRLPKKMALGEETHRGFGFVEYFSEKEAKKAFDALCQSTHLYGRRLVLEWAAVEEGIDELRKRTADHFHSSTAKKSRKGIFDGTVVAGTADGAGSDAE